MRRKDAYAALGSALGIDASVCHIGMMDVEGCRSVISAVSKIAPATYRAEGGES
jgi:hypothetical protein